MVDELWRFPSENHPKHPISGMGTFGVYIIRTIYFQDNVFSENILFEDPYLEITRFYEKIKVARRP